MDNRPVVAVLGLGAVGLPVARALGRLGTIRLRAGVRRPDAVARVHAADGTVETVVLGPGALNASSASSRPDDADRYQLAGGAALDRLCAGCELVINCANPGGGQRDVVAAAALNAGADYLDPGGGEGDLARLAGLCPAEARLVLGAGVQPGLSELVPRWLASQGPRHPLTLTAYLATLDRMTPGSASEFLASLASLADRDRDGGAGALWRAGATLPGRLEPQTDALVPFFPGPVVTYPYLSAESARLGRMLPLNEIRWYTVFEARGTMPAVLAGLAGRLAAAGDPAVLAGELISAVSAELDGRKPVQQLVCELAGRDSSRVAVLRATSSYELTATVTALTAERMLDGSLPPGPHLASDVLPPHAVTELAGRPGLAGLHVLEQSLAACAESDEGTI